MDNTKDINQKIDSRNNVSLNQKNEDPLAFFNENQGFVFVYKKTEKLATALYMITNLFGESEPMKWVLRKKVGELLSFTLGYKDISSSQHFDFVHSVRTKVLEIVSFLEVCFRSGLVSSMNFSILKNEFALLVSTLEKMSRDQGGDAVHTTLPKTFFDMAPYTTEIRSEGTMMQSPSMSTVSYGTRTEAVENGTKDIKNNSEKDVFKKTNRQNIILGLLKKKKDLTIKDIAEVIRDCSEKTIQRELLALIALGVLKKVGERRWSKYSLNIE